MSLCDALLLEPPIPNLALPRQEVWIALRTDHLKGSGTIDDPFNGGTSYTPAIQITSLTYALDDDDKPVATAYTSQNHGYSATTQFVTISGVTGDSAHLWNGTFVISEVLQGPPYGFKYNLKQEPAESVTGNPACAQPIYHFDEIMGAIQHHTAVHIGPGVFETRGMGDGSRPGWRCKSGWRILGAGTALTTLKLVGAALSQRSGHYWVFYNDRVDAGFLEGFEASDFTVDCNVEGQCHPNVNCGAFGLSGGGRHLRVRRVRAINFGSQYNGLYTENFVFAMNPPPATAAAGKDGCDCVIEDCIAEQPCPNIYWNGTIFHIGGGATTYHRGCALRRNFFDSSIIYGPTRSVASISYNPPEGGGDGVVTITTRTPHGHKHPGNVSVQGILVDNSVSNGFNGVFAIETIPSDTVLSYKPYYPPQLGDPPLYVPGKPPTPGANAIVGAPVSFHPRVVNEIAPASVPGLVKPFLVTSSWGYPHERTANNIAKLGNVSIRIQIPGQPDVILKPDNIRNKFNKTFLIHSVTARRQFLIDVTGQEWGENYSCFSVGDKALGTAHMGMSAGNGTGSVVEGNHLLHCYNSGPWADTGNTPDLTARHNYYYDIAKGPFQNMGVWRDENNRLPCNLSHDSLIATCDTSPLPHGLTVGQAIRISGTAQDNAKQYDGDFTVKSVSATNKNQFAYDLSPAPTIPGVISGHLQEANQDVHLVFENNTMHLARSLYAYWAQPTAVALAYGVESFSDLKAPCYRQVVARENVIRKLGPDDLWHSGITVRGGEHSIAEGNVIDLGGLGPHPVAFKNFSGGAAKCLNNQTSAGALLRGFDETVQQPMSELATAIEDALMLSL